ncbi:hypothetical protein T484DRAFT_3455046, partial [Baffinella frigidus]
GERLTAGLHAPLARARERLGEPSTNASHDCRPRRLLPSGRQAITISSSKPHKPFTHVHQAHCGDGSPRLQKMHAPLASRAGQGGRTQCQPISPQSSARLPCIPSAGHHHLSRKTQAFDRCVDARCLIEAALTCKLLPSTSLWRKQTGAGAQCRRPARKQTIEQPCTAASEKHSAHKRLIPCGIYYCGCSRGAYKAPQTNRPTTMEHFRSSRPPRSPRRVIYS